MSPANKNDQNKYGIDDDDESAHNNFMKSSRMLIATTKNRIGRMQAMSEELSHLTSLIRDDREETPRAVRDKRNQKDGSVKLFSGNVSQVKTSVDKSKKKDSKKVIHRSKKMSEGRRMRLIEYTLQKVKEADARERGGDGVIAGPPPNSPRSNMSTAADNYGRPYSSRVNKSLPSSPCQEKNNIVNTISVKNYTNIYNMASSHCQGNTCYCHQNNLVKSEEQTGPNKLKPKTASYISRISPTRSSVLNTEAFVGEQERIRFPAMQDGSLVTKKSKSMIGRKLTKLSDFRRHVTSLVKGDINTHIGKINDYKHNWHQNVVTSKPQIYRNSHSTTQHREILTPKIINLQTKDNTFSNCAFTPLKQLSVGYRLKLGKLSAFPVAWNHTHKLNKVRPRA